MVALELGPKASRGCWGDKGSLRRAPRRTPACRREEEGATSTRDPALQANPPDHAAVSLHLSPRIPQGSTNPALAFDDPVYGQRVSAAKPAAARRESPENIYEQLARDRP